MEDLVGRRIGPNGQYRLLRLLGRGGMGAVFEAEESEPLPRRVAIKVLDPTLTQQPGFVERFRQEARTVAALEHPHIVPVYSFGEDQGLLYLVMRLITGGSVADRLEEESHRPWELRRTLRLAQQILPALDHAHQSGVIHRDIKPGNILLQGDFAILGDFGIAKAVREDLGLTQTGTAVGTPQYMSPEQVMGQPLDGRADLYSFAVVLYELLTGRVPYVGATPMAVAVQHVHAALPPPRQANPALPPLVEEVLVQALAKNPADRFASGAALARALQGAIDEEERAPLPPQQAAAPMALGPAPVGFPASVAGPAGATTPPSPASARTVPLVPLLGGVGALAVLAALFLAFVRPGAPPATPSPSPTTLAATATAGSVMAPTTQPAAATAAPQGPTPAPPATPVPPTVVLAAPTAPPATPTTAPPSPTAEPAPPTVAPTATIAANRVALEQEVAAAFAALPADTAAVFLQPSSGARVELNPAAPHRAASVIKLPILIEAHRQAAAGQLNWDDQVTVTRERVVGGTGILQNQVGRSLSLGELATTMILYSDNTGGNILLDALGGTEAVNATMRDLGWSTTRLQRHFMDLQAISEGRENVTSAADLAAMLERALDGSLVDAKASADILDVLAARGGRDPDWLGQGLDSNRATLLHLNGTLTGVRNDAGVIIPNGGEPYVLVVLLEGTDEPALEAAIANTSRRVQGAVERNR